jgi:hypothetical protein
MEFGEILLGKHRQSGMMGDNLEGTTYEDVDQKLEVLSIPYDS